MTDKYKKEKEELNRRIYSEKNLPELKRIGKKRGLLNVDQYKKRDKNVLIERLVKGKQLSDYSKDVLLEKAQNEGLLANASMSKNVILQKITNPKLTDLNEKRLRELAEKGGVPLRSQMPNKAIIRRLENPTDYYTVESLKRLALNNNIDVARNISKPDLINILGERNLITTTPITAQESNLGVRLTNVPIELIRVAKKKARNAQEALINFKHFMKNSKTDYITSSRLKKLTKTLETRERKAREEHDKIFTFRKELSSFNNFTNQYVIDGSDIYDGRSFLMEAKNSIINVLDSNRGIKARLYFNCVMVREGSSGVQRAKFYFHSALKIILENTDVEEVFYEMVDEIETAIQKTENAEGSGWVLESIINIKLYTAEWNPLNAGSYIELPAYLRNKRAIINMKNQNDKCFLWCVLRALNPKDNHPERVDKDLISKQDTLNMKGIKYPVSFRDIDRFESLNPNISITVLGYNKNERVYPLKVSNYTGCEHDITLMLIKDEENSHYCLVNNISALLISQLNKHKGTCHICLRCLNGFKCSQSLDKHKEYCYNNECVKTIMPEKGTMLKFKNFLHSEKVPFVVYADTEALIKEMYNCDPNPENSYTKKYQKHEPVSFSYYIKCFDNSVCQPILRTYTKTTTEEDAMDIFIKWLEEDVKALANIKVKEMIFTEEDRKRFNEEKECWICKEPLNGDKVRDHCHYTGRYRGPAHNKCNLKYRKPKFIPVVFHNLSGYDSHLFIKKLGSPNEDMDCIPNNEEKYISFSKNVKVGEYKDKKTGEVKNITFKIRFIDSFKFMGSSLEALVNNLPEDAFNNLERYYTGDELKLIKRKGVYPCEYMNTEERFNETKLPPKEAFYSRLSGEGITEEDYKHALNVWDVFKMKTFKDYHGLYNETDVLLLADVFENFRNNNLRIYKLDPAHYFTAPGLSWDACLKITGVELELLSDPDMLLMWERCIRGGISMISNRYGEANNKYMGKSFNKNKPSKYIYLDANNLYGTAMCNKLPTHGFKWMSGGELEKLYENQELHTWNKTPCILEVDLEYPEKLHDSHNDYPLCPEGVKCKNNVEKLIPNLWDKKKYVLHYKNLIQCLRLGMKLTCIHRGIKFIESEWMKPYIDMNTELRAKAKNNFEKDHYKLMNNLVFGKTMENIRNRVNVKLVNNREKARKLIAKPNFRHCKIFSENLISVHMKKTSLVMNKPVYLGACILDLSKTIMYDFHYNYIKLMYGDKAKLLFTDTDSLMYEIETEDFYKDISGDVINRFDTSDYPDNHPSGIPTGCNKKVLGMFKDEAVGKCIKEFVGLRAKLYSYKMFEGEESKKCKGIKKRVVEKSITHEYYKTCLFTGKEQLRKMNIIRSYDHEVYTEEVNKVALSAEDDKRYIMEDGIHTMAWGHHKLHS